MNNFRFNDSSDTPRYRGRNRFRKTVIIGVLVVLSVALVCGAIWAFYIKKDSKTDNVYVGGNKTAPLCTDIADVKKLDCYPDSPISESECTNRGCCYKIPINSDSLPSLNVPYCYYPSNYVGYVVESVERTPRRIFATLKREGSSGFIDDVTNLNLRVSFLNDNTLRLKITDADSQRYEVPTQLYYQTKKHDNLLYDVNIDESSGVLNITRKSTGAAIFRTDLSRLVYSNQFLQISSDLPSQYIYGIGEHYGGILRSVNWTRLTLINSDLSPKPDHGLYGSQPFYIALEKGGDASGVFLYNSNIMDVILQPAPAITFRPIGGILDFFIMLGPSPKDVTRQYSSVVGKPALPPYWSLGFHLCRYGYGNLDTTKKTMQRNINANVPLDVQWNDIDYMEQWKDFTYDKKNFSGLPEFVDDIHEKGMHYVMITDPGISNSEKVYPPYDEGIDDDIFIKNENGSIFIGKVWTDGTTVYPDFSHPAINNYWTRQFKRLYDEVKFDGSWIDMNEPSNFNNGAIGGCPKSSYEKPQYVPGGNALQTKTLCMTAKHYYSMHYNEHNLYAYREAVATYEALKNIRGKRPFIISRANFAGQGVYGGHWSGDIFSTWEDMRYTIPAMINFNLYAMPLHGSDICGFNGDTTVDLCARWHALGAFYPFSRNHNGLGSIEQDPAALGPIVTKAAVYSLQKRYTMLPYLYTLFYQNRINGEPVIRPLLLEFPEDENTYDIDEQFMWGSALMIVPILYPNVTTTSAYFPKGVWYNAVYGQQMNSSGEKVSLEIPLGEIYLSVKGGTIITSQVPAQTTQASRKNPFMLAVALDDMQEAAGEMFWDDGDSLDSYENGFYNQMKFEVTKGKLTSSVVKRGYETTMPLKSINLVGLDDLPTSVSVNGKTCVTSNVTKDDPDVTIFIAKSFGIFGIQALEDVAYKEDADCRYYSLNKYIFIIEMKNGSLLSDLNVTWT